MVYKKINERFRFIYNFFLNFWLSLEWDVMEFRGKLYFKV